jgi:dienelactone hydrolase
MLKFFAPSVQIFLCVIFFSCSGGNSDAVRKERVADSLKVTVPSYDNSLEKGKVIPRIRCAKDSLVNYALYLPEKYSSEKKYPVIFCFDSHASGSLPLDKYKDLAEKYGYILAGSNNSKNGMSWEQNHPQIKTFMEDVKQRLNIDEKRIYTCGFSGGSRVACSVAIFDGGVNCVIGMGAGLPSLSEPIRNRFDYIGFAGNRDFNMNEMIGLTTSMDKSPIRHQLIIFDGKHEWAPAEIAEDAFLWCEFNAMKDKLISENDSLLKNFVAKIDKSIIESAQKKNMYQELVLYKMRVNYLEGLMDVAESKKKAEEIANSEEFKKSSLRKETLVKEELATQENYRNNFVLKDISWWTAEINKLKKLSGNKGDQEKALMNTRLISYLSLLAYMNANSCFQSRQFDLMEKFLRIYQLVDSENSEHQYLFADLYAVRKDDAKALASLKNAVKLGFNDVARMEADTLLTGLRLNSDYKQLADGLRLKK